MAEYQKERQDTELERFFDERQQAIREGKIELANVHAQHKDFKEPDTEWQKNVKGMKNEDYYSKIHDLENEQVTKEIRLREQSHQFAIPGEKIVSSSMAKGMAQMYEDNL